MLYVTEKSDNKLEMGVGLYRVFDGKIVNMDITIKKIKDAFKGTLRYDREENFGDSEFEDYFQDTFEYSMEFDKPEQFIEFLNGLNLFPLLSEDDESLIFKFVG